MVALASIMSATASPKSLDRSEAGRRRKMAAAMATPAARKALRVDMALHVTCSVRTSLSPLSSESTAYDFDEAAGGSNHRRRRGGARSQGSGVSGLSPELWEKQRRRIRGGRRG